MSFKCFDLRDYFGNTKLIAIASINPSNPIRPKPTAATAETFLNSSMDGFLKSLHTLAHCIENDLNFFIGMGNRGKECF